MTHKFPPFPKLSAEEAKFLKDMIEHHKMAIVMAREVLKTTKDNDIMFLAYSIMQSQMNEIALMQQILGQRK